jgi:hypothetical protein
MRLGRLLPRPTSRARPGFQVVVDDADVDDAKIQGVDADEADVDEL